MHVQTLVQAADELPQNLIRLSRRIQGRFNINLDVKRLDDVSHQLTAQPIV